MDTEGKIWSWSIQYIIWQPVEARDLHSIIRALPAPTAEDFDLQKSLSLKRIHFEASKRWISEKTLECLEHLEDIDFLRRGNINETVSDTMKRAYCLAAVDCTVKLLTAGDGTDADRRLRFSEMVEKLWRGRIGRMEGRGLGSDLLWGWRDDIVAAVSDEGASERVVRNFEGVGAVEAVKEYVREERERMGPPFLQRLTEISIRDGSLQNILGVVNGIHQVGEEEEEASDISIGPPPSPSPSASHGYF